MRIDCPFCGPRDVQEFLYRGDAGASHPAARPGAGPEAAAEDLSVDAVYYPENPAGEHEGLWYHRWGCRSWLIVRRDTRTHAIFSVALAKAERAS